MKSKIDLSKYGIYLVLVFMIIGSIFLSPNFLTTINLTNILKQTSVITMAAVGQTMLIIMGGIDLAVGSKIALSGICSIYAFYATESLIIAVLVGALVGAITGLIHGFVVTQFNLPPFIAGLAMDRICRGTVFLLTGGYSLYKLGNFVFLGQGELFGIIPMPAVFAVVAAIVGFIVLFMTKHGRYIYAIGGNEAASAASGIKVKNVKLKTYIFSSMIMGVAGVVLMSRMNSGNPDVGIGFEADAITASVIGGTSMLGGVGTIQGAIVGSLIVGVLQNIMNLNSVQSFVQQIVTGAIILAAVIYDLNSKNLSLKIKGLRMKSK